MRRMRPTTVLVVMALGYLLVACTSAMTSSFSTPTGTPSTGPSPLAVVPKVVGKTMGDAKEAFRGVGLTTYVSKTTFSNKPPGTIIKQSVKAGSEVKPGTEVDVVVVV